MSWGYSITTTKCKNIKEEEKQILFLLYFHIKMYFCDPGVGGIGMEKPFQKFCFFSAHQLDVL